MNIYDELNFEKAVRRIIKDKRDDPIHDVTQYRDLLSKRQEIFEDLEVNLRDFRKYNSEYGQVTNIPKKGFTVRPAVQPEFIDRILYQALADRFQELFVPEENVYSNLANKSDSDYMFIDGVKSWIGFQNKIEENCRKYPYVIKTDLTAYFEHVNHKLLNSRIDDLFSKYVEKEYLDGYKILLNKLLKRWGSPHLNEFSLPQINDPSSFFGNIYLDEIDKWLINNKITSVRYVDDIWIFVDSKPKAKKILCDLIVELRYIGLYVSSAKTDILETAKVLENLISRRFLLENIDDDLNSKDIERIGIAANKICDLFNQILDKKEDFDDRLFRYCINRFKKFAASGICEFIHDIAIPQVISRLEFDPVSTDIYSDYLSMFPDDELIQKIIIEFLLSENNIYPWQEMHLLELLIRSNLSNENFKKISYYLRDKSINSHDHPITRKALVLWGKNGSYADKREIRSLYSQKSELNDKRAILLAIQEMQEKERNNFYQDQKGEKEINYCVDYIKSLNNPIYHYFNPPEGYDIFYDDSNIDDSDDLRDLGSGYFL